MARNRTVNGNLWKHRAIRKAALHVGWLYAYAITVQADDEGRFVADGWALTDDAFSSEHDIGEEQVEQALSYLEKHGLMGS
jgi:hypothetical protein